MKQYRIELRREYFEERVFVDEHKDIERITGLLWGLCSIPCDTYKWMPTSNRSAIIFSAVCNKEHLTKFLDAFYLIYPGIEDYIKVVEEDEQRRDELYL